jgi:DNA-binding transcriptional MerR regulator
MTAGGANELRQLLERQDLTMEELVDATEALLRTLAPKQTRYKVTERPDARTIRYYIAQQLLPRALGYDGGRARYGGSHVLRLLLIKRLQAEHHTLARIARVLDGATDADVLDALVRADPAAGGAAALSEAAAAEAGAGKAGPVHGRIDLAPGGSLEIPDEVLRDPDKRAQVAASLEAVARWLRQTQGDDA